MHRLQAVWPGTLQRHEWPSLWKRLLPCTQLQVSSDHQSQGSWSSFDAVSCMSIACQCSAISCMPKAPAQACCLLYMMHKSRDGRAGDRESRLLSGMLIRELQKQAAEAFSGQASQVISASSCDCLHLHHILCLSVAPDTQHTLSRYTLY